MTLLSLLLIHPGSVVDSSALADGIWGDAAPSDPEAAVRFHIWKLRKTLEPDRSERAAQSVIVKANSGYQIATDGHRFDTIEFEHLIGDARSAMAHAGGLDKALSLVDSALELWRGLPLSQLRYHDVAQSEIRRLLELHLEAQSLRAETLIALDRHREAVPFLEALTEEHPLTEPVWHLLITALSHAGRPADALTEYRRMEQHLIDELGVTPSDELVALRRQILEPDN